MNDVILVYIYKSTSDNKCEVPELKLTDLMCAPIGVSKRLWSNGFFEQVKNEPIKPDDIFQKHCFKSFNQVTGTKFYDEYGTRLDEPFEPCGTWGMSWHLAIDRVVSNYMGIPLAS